MKAISELIYERGKRGTKYLRMRIPADVRSAFPAGKTHVTRSLATSDLQQAKQRARIVLAALERDFCRVRKQQALRAQHLTSENLISENTWRQLRLELNVAASGAYSPNQGRWRTASGELEQSSPPPGTHELVADERCAQVMTLMRQARLGFKESSAQRRRKRRLPFDVGDLQLIFGSAVYTEHVRSSGQSGEASYWLPLLLFYTGARPEEVAGLAIADVVKDKVHGWHFIPALRAEPATCQSPRACRLLNPQPGACR